MSTKLKIFLLLIGDVVTLYVSLFLALALRYGVGFYGIFESAHALPFTVIFPFWILIFYIAGLYDLRRLRNNLDFVKTIWLAVLTSAIVSIFIFYAVPAFGIAPKVNLLLFVLIFTLIETVTRQSFNRNAARGESPNKVLLIGDEATAEIERIVKDSPQFGYEVRARMSSQEALEKAGHLERLVEEKQITCVVAPRSLGREGHLPETLYRVFSKGIIVIDLAHFYELIMRKIPLVDIEQAWFFENIEGAAQFYDPLKRAWELIVAILMGTILIPVEILIAILITLTSRGPIIYRQTRVGKYGKEFRLYKFRSMKALTADGSAEVKGAQWATQSDKRTTLIGGFLRGSHLDELPQLLNVIKGDLSFVGPRPERPEFVKKLQQEIPFYGTRLLVKPGITGWAQINYRADLDLEDVKQKLQYDIYYLKNRSLLLDLAIIVKTIKSFFVNPT